MNQFKVVLFAVIAGACLMSASCNNKVTKGDLGNVEVEKYTFTGIVTYGQDYCGGANPSVELVRDLKKQKPYANQTMFIRAGRLNNFNREIIAELKTDKDGKFSIELPAGRYSVVTHQKKNDVIELPRLVSEISCRDWLAEPDFSFKLPDDALEPQVKEMYLRCSRCEPPRPVPSQRQRRVQDR